MELGRVYYHLEWDYANRYKYQNQILVEEKAF